MSRSPAAPLTPIELAALSDEVLAAEIERHNRLALQLAGAA